MSDCRIDLDAIRLRTMSLSFDEVQNNPISDVAPEVTADVTALIGEVRRLLEVQDRWSAGWQGIIEANTTAWIDRVKFLEEREAQLIKIIEES